MCLCKSTILFFDNSIVGFAEAFFEATSGLTTTGASIYNNVENLSIGLLVWRSLIQWLGGIGIIIFTEAILPILNIGGEVLVYSGLERKRL